MQSTEADIAFENGVTFHHLGYVVPSIERAAKGFARSLALDWDGKIIHDPLQQVRVSFFRPHRDSGPVIELVEPSGSSSPVSRFLERGGGLHHLCYEVQCLEKQLAWSEKNGDLVIRTPVPAAAFYERRIAWIYTRSKMLVEYLERTRSTLNQL